MATFVGTNASETITPTLVSPSVVAVGGAAPSADADIINGGGGVDTLDGDGGGDTITGGPGNDSVFGGAGNDRLIWNSGDGSDLLEGGDDSDTVEVNGSSASETFTITANGARVRLDGIAPVAFTLDIGTTENLVVTANGGNDTITAGNGLSALIAVTLDGGAGNDTITGGDGIDKLIGGDGNDTITGGRGNDVALMGTGNDRYIWNPGDGSDIVEGQGDLDTLEFHGANISERIDISANGGRVRFTRDVANITMDLNDVERIEHNALGGADTITVNDLAGTDVKQVVVKLAGTFGGATGDGQVDTVVVNGTVGVDSVTVTGDLETVNVSGLATSVSALTAEAIDVVRINGLAGKDIINAAAAAHAVAIDGGADDDTITGGSGVDTLIGGADNDTINGGAGTDTILGDIGDDRTIWSLGGGSDVMEGGDGIDTVEVQGDFHSEILTISANGTRVRFDGISPVAYTLDIGTTENLIVNGNGGSDTITAGNGLSVLISLTIDGGDGNDVITGGDGADMILAGTGTDTVKGGRGNDTAFLGAGVDHFIWNPGDGSDTVEGQEDLDTLQFNGANISERIDISANGGRARFTRDVANIVMDLHGVEHVEYNALGGADTITVNNLQGTNVNLVGVKLAATLDGATGDGQVDTVIVNGGAGQDIIKIIGTATNPIVTGLAASVSISTLEASDVVHINTFAGNDNVNASLQTHAFFIDGGADNDTLIGGQGGDTLVGGTGNDNLDGGANPSSQGDVMLGGEGNDTYHVDSGLDLVDEDIIFPGFGHGGTDTIISTTDFYWDTQSVGEVDQVAANVVDAGNDGVTVIGGIFNNTLIGHAGTDVLFGRGGSDIYRGGDGVDYISLSTLGLTNTNAYVGVDGNNTVVVDPRSSGPFSYDIVFEFDPLKDKVDVSNYGLYASGTEVLNHAVDDGAGNCYVVLGDGLDYLYMVGLERADLNAGDFIV